MLPLVLIKEIGEQEVKDVLGIAKEQEKMGKESGKEIKNMGGLISYLIQTEAWKPLAEKRKAKEKAQKKAEERKKKAARSKKVAQLVESINETYNKACLDYKQEQWTQLDDWQQEQIRQEIKQNGKSFALEFLDKHGWDEEGMFFITEREAAMKRLDIPFELPEHLSSKESYIKSQAQYQNNELEVIQEVIATLKKQ